MAFLSRSFNFTEIIGDNPHELGPRVKHVHIKDHKGTQSVGLGKGDTNNKDFVKRLSRIGYQGELSMELEVEDKENIDTYLKEGYGYMKDLVRLS